MFLGLSGVPLRKSRLPTCFMGNMELLCKECRGIGTHLTTRDYSHLFSRVAARSWGTFSTYGGDGYSTHVSSVTSELLSSYEGNLRNLQEPRQDNMDASPGEEGDPKSLLSSYSDIGIHVNFQEESGIVTF